MEFNPQGRINGLPDNPESKRTTQKKRKKRVYSKSGAERTTGSGSWHLRQVAKVNRKKSSERSADASGAKRDPEARTPKPHKTKLLPVKDQVSSAETDQPIDVLQEDQLDPVGHQTGLADNQTELVHQREENGTGDPGRRRTRRTKDGTERRRKEKAVKINRRVRPFQITGCKISRAEREEVKDLMMEPQEELLDSLPPELPKTDRRKRQLEAIRKTTQAYFAEELGLEAALPPDDHYHFLDSQRMEEFNPKSPGSPAIVTAGFGSDTDIVIEEHRVLAGTTMRDIQSGTIHAAVSNKIIVSEEPQPDGPSTLILKQQDGFAEEREDGPPLYHAVSTYIEGKIIAGVMSRWPADPVLQEVEMDQNAYKFDPVGDFMVSLMSETTGEPADAVLNTLQRDYLLGDRDRLEEMITRTFGPLGAAYISGMEMSNYYKWTNKRILYQLNEQVKRSPGNATEKAGSPVIIKDTLVLGDDCIESRVADGRGWPEDAVEVIPSVSYFGMNRQDRDFVVRDQAKQREVMLRSLQPEEPITEEMCQQAEAIYSATRDHYRTLGLLPSPRFRPDRDYHFFDNEGMDRYRRQYHPTARGVAVFGEPLVIVENNSDPAIRAFTMQHESSHATTAYEIKMMRLDRDPDGSMVPTLYERSGFHERTQKRHYGSNKRLAINEYFATKIAQGGISYWPNYPALQGIDVSGVAREYSSFNKLEPIGNFMVRAVAKKTGTSPEEVLQVMQRLNLLNDTDTFDALIEQTFGHKGVEIISSWSSGNIINCEMILDHLYQLFEIESAKEETEKSA